MLEALRSGIVRRGGCIVAVKTISNANVIRRNVEEMTGFWAETVPVFIEQPGPFDFFPGPTAHLISVDMTELDFKDSLVSRRATRSETSSLRYERDWALAALNLVPIQDLLGRFVNSANLRPVPASVANAVVSLFAYLLRQRCKIAGTITEDGVLALETRLGSDVQLFVEMDRDGAVEASIFEPGVGIRGLGAATVPDLEWELIERILN